jgi:teichuronic acid biosynthesis glycosyltransferase TuaC
LSRHILVIPSWYSDGRGSGGGYFRDQALALQAAGHRVAILAPTIHTWRDVRGGRMRRRRPGEAMVESDGVAIYRRDDFTALPRLPYRNPLAWSRCGMKLTRRYLAENGRPDLVHAHSCLNAGVLAAAIKRRYGVPFILTEHSVGPASARWWERDLIDRVIREASRCIAVSPHLAGLLQRRYPGSSWSYVPNILGDTFSAVVPPAVTPREKTAFVFVCVARMSPEKGHSLLIEAFAGAFAGDPDVRLRLVGDGPSRPVLEQLCCRLGIPTQIDFVGSLSAAGVRATMEAADAFVLASRFETFGVVVIEAFACGLPVVSTACGGPDHLIDMTNGLLVRPEDPQALRDALMQMRRRAGCYDRVAIRADAMRRFGPDAFARQFAAMIC